MVRRGFVFLEVFEAARLSSLRTPFACTLIPEAVMLAKKIRQVLYASGIEIASARRFYNRE